MMCLASRALVCFLLRAYGVGGSRILGGPLRGGLHVRLVRSCYALLSLPGLPARVQVRAMLRFGLHKDGQGQRDRARRADLFHWSVHSCAGLPSKMSAQELYAVAAIVRFGPRDHLHTGGDLASKAALDYLAISRRIKARTAGQWEDRATGRTKHPSQVKRSTVSLSTLRCLGGS